MTEMMIRDFNSFKLENVQWLCEADGSFKSHDSCKRHSWTRWNFSSWFFFMLSSFIYSSPDSLTVHRKLSLGGKKKLLVNILVHWHKEKVQKKEKKHLDNASHTHTHTKLSHTDTRTHTHSQIAAIRLWYFFYSLVDLSGFLIPEVAFISL